MTDPVRRRGNGVEIAVRVQPGARRTEVAGLHGLELRVRVAAPPVDGRANQALLQFLAERLGVPLAAVSLEAGAAARSKRVVVAGVAPDAARRRLGIEEP